MADCRVYQSWGSPEKRGTSNVSTRDDDDDARASAFKKMRSLLRKGFVEAAPAAGIVFDQSANVLETMATEVNYEGKPEYDLQPVPGRPFVYAHRNVSLAEWLMISDDGCSAVRMGSSVYGSTLPEAEREAMASALLDGLAERRREILEDRTTPLRAFPLRAPVGRFTRLVVLSPTTENANVANHVLGRSLYRAFPAFECEVNGDESVTVAEARCEGHGALLGNHWDREPHPVFDLAYLKKAGDTPRFLVFPPEELEYRLGAAGLARMREPELHVRNYAREVRRIVRGGPPPDLAELRAFFGFAS